MDTCRLCGKALQISDHEFAKRKNGGWAHNKPQCCIQHLRRLIQDLQHSAEGQKEWRPWMRQLQIELTEIKKRKAK